MTIKPTDSSQGDSGNSPPAPDPTAPPDNSRGGNKVFKSGPLFLSSKGIGWTSWKKRWFILTRTSLVFYRSDPSAVQKGSEVNLTLGGIDLNNTGSVVVKSDKKLLTVLFPDGRDGRAFTLKAETMEDLYEWKIALEEALAQAPSGTYVMGQNGVFRNDLGDAADAKEKQSVKSLVVGRPVLLALEDIDGTPSFLEKALQFVEDHGVKVEGILRQAADVDDVEHRIREYEQGKTDFSPHEDAHVIADCVKYVIRELPSSPVPASCCKALLEACRTDRSKRLAAMREAICETFPEPNRKLLQRILSMMQTVASHKDVNRMSSSAVAACMAPLLLRPLLAGDCELENDFDLGGDGSVQLLQAAAAANHAQAIVVTLLEEYESIFGGGVVSTELYSDTEESGSESEELTDDDDDDESYDDDDEDEDEDEDDGTEGSDIDGDSENASNGTHSDIGESGEADDHEDKESNGVNLHSKSNESEDHHDVKQMSSSSSPKNSLDQQDNIQSSETISNQCSNSSVANIECDSSEMGFVHKLNENSLANIQSSIAISNWPAPSVRRPAVWGRTPGKKNLSMESIELPSEDEFEIEKLEIAKMELEKKLADEAKGNAALQASIEKRKNALYDRRLVLEQDVARLKEQLLKERELRDVLEAGMKNPSGFLPATANIDEKTKAEFEEIARIEKDVNKLNQTACDLGEQLSQQRELNYGSSYPTKEDSSQQSKRKEKGKNAESKASLHSSRRLTRNEGALMHNLDHDKEMKQQLDYVRSTKSHSMTSASFNPKKSGTRGEGVIPTSSALSKLTNRLNFLKERRSQIANEIHSFDKNRVPDPSGKSSGGSNVDKFQGLEIAGGKEGYKFENTDKNSGQDSCSLPIVGRFDDQSSPNLEKGKSESFPNPEKGRRPDGHPHFPPRTYSR